MMMQGGRTATSRRVEEMSAKVFDLDHSRTVTNSSELAFTLWNQHWDQESLKFMRCSQLREWVLSMEHLSDLTVVGTEA